MKDEKGMLIRIKSFTIILDAPSIVEFEVRFRIFNKRMGGGMGKVETPVGLKVQGEIPQGAA